MLIASHTLHLHWYLCVGSRIARACDHQLKMEVFKESCVGPHTHEYLIDLISLAF